MIGKRLTVALFGNEYQASKLKYVEEVLQELLKYGADIYIDLDFKNYIIRYLTIDVSNFKYKQLNHYVTLDLIISLGGDGTFLKTVNRIYNHFTEVPILGINMGHLGFLADVSPHFIKEAVAAIYDGRYSIESRSLIESLSVDINSNTEIRNYALNEIAVLKVDNSSLINISVCIDKQYLTDYVADGLIICTPTGSTGYSLSVNGPIISPNCCSFCLSPVAPHSLNLRPVVIDDLSEIKLKVSSRTNKYLLASDGRSTILSTNIETYLRKAKSPIKVMKISHQNFYDTLRDKMNWGEDLR